MLYEVITSYGAIKLLSGRAKDVSVSVWVLAVLFLAHIVFFSVH